MRWQSLFVVPALALLGTVAACGATSGEPSGDAGADAPIGAFGCCEGYRPGCTLFRNGPKRSADDTCIDGNDGVVIDPNQPGWTESTDAYGCIRWTPPPNPKRFACGVAPPFRDADVPDDGATSGDARGDGATDGATDGAADGGDGG